MYTVQGRDSTEAFYHHVTTKPEAMRLAREHISSGWLLIWLEVVSPDGEVIYNWPA